MYAVRVGSFCERYASCKYIFAYVYACVLILYTISNIFLTGFLQSKQKMERSELQEKIVFNLVGNGELEKLLNWRVT